MTARIKQAGERLDINNGAYLKESATGTVCLCFRGLEYEADDAVPLSIYGKRASFENQHADAFVRGCMRDSNGDGDENWPELALRFVSKHSPQA